MINSQAALQVPKLPLTVRLQYVCHAIITDSLYGIRHWNRE